MVLLMSTQSFSLVNQTVLWLEHVSEKGGGEKREKRSSQMCHRCEIRAGMLCSSSHTCPLCGECVVWPSLLSASHCVRMPPLFICTAKDMQSATTDHVGDLERKLITTFFFCTNTKEKIACWYKTRRQSVPILQHHSASFCTPNWSAINIPASIAWGL